MRNSYLNKLKWTVIVFATLVAMGVIFVALFNWNLLRGYISDKVTEKTGRALTISGNLDVDFLPFPARIHVEQLRLSNATWGTDETMLDIQQLDFSISLLSLLKGDIVLPEVSLTGAHILLEKSADGKRNWILRKQQNPDDKAPRIGRLSVDTSTFIFRDPSIKTDLRVNVFPVLASQDARQSSIQFSAQGKFKGQTLKAHGQAGKILSLLDQSTPYPIKADIQISATHALIDGTVTGLSTLAAVNMQTDVRGNDLSALYPLIAIPLPPTPPYKIAGRLIYKNNVWYMNNFSGKVGDSDLGGDFSVDIGGQKPFLRGDVISRKLDIDDLGGFIGAPPETGAGETASTAQKIASRALERRSHILPNITFKPDRLRAINADIKFSANSIRGRELPLDDLKVHMKIENGQVALQPLNFGVAGGHVISNIVLNANMEPLTAQADITIKKLSMNKLFPGVKLTKTSIGLIGGQAKLSGNGNSVAQLLASADGQAGFSMSGGKISNLLLEIIGLDGGEIIKFLFGGDKTVAIRCMVADFRVNDGIMRTQVFVLDTTDTNISGDGEINLKDESINMTLRPLPKDASFLSVRSPLFARGTFKHPTFKPDMTRVAERTGAALIFGALLTPLAAIIPLVETGPGKDSDCADLIASIGQHAVKK